MPKTDTIDFPTLQAALTTQNIMAHASEVQGVLAGLICGGYAFDNTDYLILMADIFNNGDKLPKDLSQTVQQLYASTWQQLLDTDYGFTPLLPDEDDSLAERSNGLSVWVQGFNLGFGLQHKNVKHISKSSLSAEVQEILQDFSEIANLATDMEDDDENEQAFYEVCEYVRMSAMLCFSELATLPKKPEQKTLH